MTPVLGSLHPSAILDSLHWKCVQELKQQAAERGEVARDNVVDDLDGVGADERDSKMSCVQVMFSLSKVHPHTTLLATIPSYVISMCLYDVTDLLTSLSANESPLFADAVKRNS